MQPWEKMAGLFFNMEKTNILSNTDGFHLYGWMVNELHLEGGDLITFALVYTFTQSHAGIYKGNTAYLSAWTGWSTRCSRQHLAKLAEMGLIEEQRGTKDGTPYCYYSLGKNFIDAMKKFHSAYEKNDTPPMKNFQGRIEKKEEKQELIPPTPQEVTKYASERGFRDPAGFAATFVAYYEAAHWCKKDGSKIRNWRQAVITWEANNKNRVFPKDSNSENKQIGWEQYEKIMQN